jgi:hypothetical protein
MSTHEKILTSYIKLRDEKAKVEKRHKLELAQYTEAMMELETYLKDYLRKQNLQHISSGDITAFLSTSRKATLQDSGVFREFIIENGNFDLADFRPKVEAVEDYVEEHEGKTPPGVNFQTAITLRVQRR